jgi:hypothetical protein
MQQAMGSLSKNWWCISKFEHSRRPPRPRKQRAGGPSLQNLSKYLTRGFLVQEDFPARDNACQVMQEKDFSKADLFYSQPIPVISLRSTTRCMPLPVAFSNKFFCQLPSQVPSITGNHSKANGSICLSNLQTGLNPFGGGEKENRVYSFVRVNRVKAANVSMPLRLRFIGMHRAVGARSPANRSPTFQ